MQPINIKNFRLLKMENIASGLKNGDTILYVGMGIYEGAEFSDGSAVPFDSDSMILAMNEGRAMAPRLMYEYTRAAMSIEQNRGRKFLEQKMSFLFAKAPQKVKVLELIEKLKPKYIIDMNYDFEIPKMYSNEPHYVIIGKARIGAELDRFEIMEWDNGAKKYEKVDKEFLRLDMPIIFKPMGSISPNPTFIISDADFVDWLTEAMGGFAVPPSLKEYRDGKQYLMLGLGFAKDTERMVANELTLGLSGGYFVYAKEPTKNCLKFLKSHNMELIAENPNDFAAKLLEVV